MTIHAVVFDLMDTLLYDPYREALDAALSRTWDPRRADRQAWPDFERGVITAEEFERRFAAGGAVDFAALHRVRRANYGWLDGAEELLDDTASVVPTWLATNYPVWIDEVDAVFRLSERCEGVVASCRIGVRKPDPAYFEALLDAAGLTDPSGCAFVDDRAINVEAARTLGFSAHLAVDTPTTRAWLAGLGVAV